MKLNLKVIILIIICIVSYSYGAYTTVSATTQENLETKMTALLTDGTVTQLIIKAVNRNLNFDLTILETILPLHKDYLASLEIDFSQNQITNITPLKNAIVDLTLLQSLKINFSDNYVTNIMALDGIFDNLSFLKETILIFNINQISMLTAFQNMPTLINLITVEWDFSENQIDDLSTDAIGLGLKSQLAISTLDLRFSKNFITHLDWLDDTFYNKHNLVTLILYVDDNDIVLVAPIQFLTTYNSEQDMTNMTLNLEKTKIIDLIPLRDTLAGCLEMTTLTLYFRQVSAGEDPHLELQHIMEGIQTLGLIPSPLVTFSLYYRQKGLNHLNPTYLMSDARNLKTVTLNFSQNNLVDITSFPDTFDTLTRLEYLNINMDQNLLQDLAPMETAFDNLIFLDTLIFSVEQNLISNLTPLTDAFDKVLNLQTLDINFSQNSISDLAPLATAYRDLANLATFTMDFSENFIADVTPLTNAFDPLTGMTTFNLYLQDNWLADLAPFTDAFQQLQNLENFIMNVNDNRIVDITPFGDTFQDLNSMKVLELWMNGNDIENVEVMNTAFEGLPNIKRLEVHSDANESDDVSGLLEPFNTLDSLDVLDLDFGDNQNILDLRALNYAMDEMYDHIVDFSIDFKNTSVGGTAVCQMFNINLVTLKEQKKVIYFAEDGSCSILQCGDKHYLGIGTCEDCNIVCGSCEENVNCETCPDTRENAPTCSCKEQHYELTPIEEECALCQPHCKNCETTDGNCTECFDALQTVNDCACPDGYYRDPVTYLCVQCTFPCANCSSDTVCLSCDGVNRTTPDCDCDYGTYANAGTGNICIDCGYPCDNCDSNGDCTVCLGDTNRTSVFPECACEDGFYDDANTCLGVCNYKCEACITNATTCTKCHTTRTGAQCLCKDTFYDTGLNDEVCASCQHPCVNCSAIDTCTSCIVGANRDTNHPCDCLPGWYENTALQCVQCPYPCNTCDGAGVCETCLGDANRSAVIPDCECLPTFYDDGDSCEACVGLCDECTASNVCTTCHGAHRIDFDCHCEDGWYDNGVDIDCQPCIHPCVNCLSDTVCKTCVIGVIGQNRYAPDTCLCLEGFYENSVLECERCDGICENCQTQVDFCIQCTDHYQLPPTCGKGVICEANQFMYHNVCEECDAQCASCHHQRDLCTSCPVERVLYQGKCVGCDDIEGMMQDPNQAIGVCIEICGDGIRLSETYHECDDGNNISGDGCDSDCKLESGFDCGSEGCYDASPIGFFFSTEVGKQYLNLYKNAPFEVSLVFNKTFSLPSGKQLKDYIKIVIEGHEDEKIDLDVKLATNKRILSEKQDGSDTIIEYQIKAEFPTTIKNRVMYMDLEPKQDFTDQNGNNLANIEPQGQDVQEYYHYSDSERQTTKIFEILLTIGIVILLLFIPIYVFWYKEHYNRFYVIFFVIDITQLLYFYRFINIRWPINGVFFFRRLRPVINFFMWNFFEHGDYSDEDYEKAKTGITKFDKEYMTSSFLDNAGGLLMLLLIFIMLYAVIKLFSVKQLYPDNGENKFFKFFNKLRIGYFEWGIWFDAIQTTSGVFIFFIILQLTNLHDGLSVIVTILVATLYFGFIGWSIYFTHKHEKVLHNIEREPLDSMTEEEKYEKFVSFRLRNAWHFIQHIHRNGRKGYFYHLFTLRKIYTAVILIALQNHPKLQISMICFSHLIIFGVVAMYKFFEHRRETLRICLGELFIIIGIFCMYFMLDDTSEDEPSRLTFSWWVIASFLFSLLIQGMFFFYQEIILPLLEKCCPKKHKEKIVDLRKFRTEGKMTVDVNELTEKRLSRYATNLKKSQLQLNQSQKSLQSQKNIGSLKQIHYPQDTAQSEDEEINTPDSINSKNGMRRQSRRNFTYQNNLNNNNNNNNTKTSKPSQFQLNDQSTNQLQKQGSSDENIVKIGSSGNIQTEDNLVNRHKSRQRSQKLSQRVINIRGNNNSIDTNGGNMNMLNSYDSNDSPPLTEYRTQNNLTSNHINNNNNNAIKQKGRQNSLSHFSPMPNMSQAPQEYNIQSDFVIKEEGANEDVISIDQSDGCSIILHDGQSNKKL